MKRFVPLLVILLTFVFASAVCAETAESGLYVFTAGEGASLTIRGDGFTQTFSPEAGSGYCFYLADGASYECTGGTVEPLDANGLFSDAEQTIGPAGRYFVGAQLPRGGFRVRLAEGVSEGYFLISSMMRDAGIGDEPERIDLTGELVARIMLEDGQFIELHGCLLSLTEGDG